MADTIELRTPEYISPSGLKCFEKDLEEYFRRYLSPYRTPRMPQTKPMSVGSAFDAFVKSFLHYRLFGNYGDKYELNQIFEDQVEEHNRDFAWTAGEYVFKCYKDCGALSDMVLELNKASNEPRFEFEIKDTVSTSVGHIPLLGKPDIFFINNEGARVIWDWKVNGYCGNKATSPNKGYVKCRDAWREGRKNSRGNNQPHKDAILKDMLGITINAATTMENLHLEWADQLTIYGWLLGEPVGSENLIVGIDQIVSTGLENGNPPFLRIANFRNIVSSDHQYTLLNRLEFLWATIKSGKIFYDVSDEENDSKISRLLEETKALSSDDPFAQFINECRQ